MKLCKIVTIVIPILNHYYCEIKLFETLKMLGKNLANVKHAITVDNIVLCQVWK